MSEALLQELMDINKAMKEELSKQNIILNDGKPRWCPLRSKDDS